MDLPADDLPISQNPIPPSDDIPLDDKLFLGPTEPPTSSHVSPDTTPTSDQGSDTPTDDAAQQVIMSDGDVAATDMDVVQVAEQGDKGAEAEPEIGPQPAVKEEGEVSLDHVNGGQIELLGHAQGGYMGAGEGNGVVTDGGEEWMVDNSDHELKRVKVYELVGAKWEDQGTAFCFGQFSEETNEALLVARSERNYNDIILSTTIRSNDVYQRQQDTLIVWTEPDGVDYALSFQDPEGCSEVWQFILEVQRHMNATDNLSSVASSPLLGPDTSVTTASILRSGHLPQPQLGVIGEIEKAIKVLTRTALMKERICEYIQHENYVKSLIDVMHTAEELESLENLHALCSLMQTILMLNDHAMYEHIMEDDLFYGVVGILEYDPDFPDHKANYRDFLNDQSQFHQPIPIRDPSIQRKIHNAYRLQFLKDVVLARAIDDSTFNVINSCILFNQIDIISHVQHDPNFLRDLVSLFVDEGIFLDNGRPQPPAQQHQGNLPPNQIIISLNGGSDERDDEMDVDPKLEGDGPSSSTTVTGSPSTSKIAPKGSEAYQALRQYYQQHYSFMPRHDLSESEINLRREVIILLQQLCVMGKNVQLPARLSLFRSLVDRGVVFVVQWAISLSDKEESNKSMISAGGEVLSALLDHDLNGVRSHVNKHVDAIVKEKKLQKKFADTKGETLLDAMCRIMATTKDLAVQSQIGDALKTWLEVPPDLGGPTPGGAGGSDGPSMASTPPKGPMARREGEAERFLDYFYRNCINVIFKPLMDLPEWKNVKEPILPLYREEASRFTYLADLFHSFIAQHGFRSHLFCISSNILGRIASLLKVKDKHLRHSAFRIFRFLLKQNNPVATNVMCKFDVFRPILQLTLQESRRDNLLSCSCQELFDSMRRDNIKELIKFCMTHHEDLIRKLARTPLGGQRFELFIKRYEINCQPPPPDNPKTDRTVDPRAWGASSRRIADHEEEDYFNGDEEDEEDEETGSVIINPQWARAASPILPMPSISNLKARRKRNHVRSQTPSRLVQKPALGSLLDYDDDDEEDTPPSGGANTTVSSITLEPSPELFSPSSSTITVPLQPPEGEDDEDRLLDSLVSPSTAALTTPSTPRQPPSIAPSPTSTTQSTLQHLTQLASAGLSIPLRLGEKRRRDQDDEEDGLERLRKSKKTTAVESKNASSSGESKGPYAAPHISSTQGSSGLVKGKTEAAKTGDDPPPNRLWKVKVGGPSWLRNLAPQKSTVTSSQPGAKDGDTG